MTQILNYLALLTIAIVLVLLLPTPWWVDCMLIVANGWLMLDVARKLSR